MLTAHGSRLKEEPPKEYHCFGLQKAIFTQIHLNSILLWFWSSQLRQSEWIDECQWSLFDLYHMLPQMEFMGVVCRDAVNDCDIPENCTGNSSQVSISFSPTGALNLILAHSVCHSISFFLCYAVSAECAQDGWLHLWKRPGQMYEKWFPDLAEFYV